MRGRVLVIAGSDSGGGAGIQADIKTITALGGFAATAITALTAQNTEGVSAILDVPGAFVLRQIEVVLDDIGADCIKIGMLHRGDIIEAVAGALERWAAKIPVVLDPVMVAKGGHSLLAGEAIDLLRRRLVPRADLLTPNLPEADVLTGGGDGDPSMLASRLQALGPAAVLLKGGHGTGPILRDILVRRDAAPEVFESPRIETRHTHGTGCTLASAIACGLAQGLDVRAAVVRGRAFVRAAMLTAPGYGRGHGPLNHAHAIAVGDDEQLSRAAGRVAPPGPE